MAACILTLMSHSLHPHLRLMSLIGHAPLPPVLCQALCQAVAYGLWTSRALRLAAVPQDRAPRSRRTDPALPLLPPPSAGRWPGPPSREHAPLSRLPGCSWPPSWSSPWTALVGSTADVPGSVAAAQDPCWTPPPPPLGMRVGALFSLTHCISHRPYFKA